VNQTTNDFLENLKIDVLTSLQSKGGTATGETEQQIKIINNGNNIQLQLPAYLLELEKGRGPTSKNATPGNPPMIQRIQQWCRAKGIPDKAAWAIKKKIDKVGYPGKPGILTEPLGIDNINLRLNQSLQKMADNITTEILNNLPV
jgi:hypothetical protein